MNVMKHINDKLPNFYNNEGGFYLVKCFHCAKSGRENYASSVATGACAFCGWSLQSKEKGGLQ